MGENKRILAAILTGFMLFRPGNGWTGEAKSFDCCLKEANGYLLRVGTLKIAAGIGRVILKDSNGKPLVVILPAKTQITSTGEKGWTWESRDEKTGFLATGKIVLLTDGIRYTLEYEFDRDFDGTVDPSLDLFPDSLKLLLNKKYLCLNTEGTVFQGKFPSAIPEQQISLPPVREYSGMNRPFRQLKIFLENQEIEIKAETVTSSEDYNNFYYGGSLDTKALLNLNYRKQSIIPAGFFNSLQVDITLHLLKESR